MHGLAAALLLVACAVAIAGIARQRGWSAPLLLVLAGLVASYLPGVPTYRLDPEVVLLLFLPPLLFSAALDSSYLDIRRNLRPILLLSVGLVLFTAATVALTAHALVPDMGLAAALTLGAIVAPPDAVATTSIGRTVGLPRRMLVILAGESLLNDATALTVYRVAVSAALGGGFSLLLDTGEFFYAVATGVTGGLVVGALVNLLSRHLSDPVLETTLRIIAPFAAYLPIERIHGSAVLAVVTAGLYLGHRGHRTATYASRLQTTTVWRMISFLLESVVFALIGLQLREVARTATDRPVGEVVAVTLAIIAAVILTRAAWIFPATYVSRVLFPRAARPPWQVPTVLSWAGMRGVVSLAAAFALPSRTGSGEPFPQRELILFLTFCVVVTTLVLQGFSLPTVIRRLGVVNPEEAKREDLAEAAAQQAAARAALQRLEDLLDESAGTVPDDVVDQLRNAANSRALRAWERLGGGTGRGFTETPTASYRRLRLEMLNAERQVFFDLRDAGRIDDEVLRRVIRDLDFEEATLTRE